ncbi:cytochrome P450 89A2-like [Oryza brachyantha]|uniref:cytochrome P450 89A2-like n=1 Tax=Oryza brachyantha TaxID=4533 RepID=UPI0007764A7E|nr:cytochrome P450 89A2-like [Oryza brachyantha]
MRAAQQEFLRFLPSARVFSTFQTVARLVYRDRWRQLLRHRRRQEEMYLPLIRARKEQRRTRDTTATTTYVDTLLDLKVPADGDRRRNLTDGEMVGLVSEYLGAATEMVVAQLEWTLANLTRQPDIQTRLRSEVEAAAGGEPCAYLRAVVMESLRRHPPVSSVQRHMACDVTLGTTRVARGNVVSFAIEEIGRDNKVDLAGGVLAGEVHGRRGRGRGAAGRRQQAGEGSEGEDDAVRRRAEDVPGDGLRHAAPGLKENARQKSMNNHWQAM